MQHVVGVGHGLCRDVEVGEIAFDQLDARQVLEIAPLSGDETVGHAHGMSTPDQLLCQMRSDEAGAAGYEISRHDAEVCRS